MSMQPALTCKFYKRMVLQALVVSSFCAVYAGVQLARQTVHDIKIAKIHSLHQSALNLKSKQ